MKKLLYLILFFPLNIFGQTEIESSILNDIVSSFNNANPPIYKNLNQGWNMFGYPCLNSIDVAEAFSSYSESVITLKDNSGSVWLPEYNFNGIGDLHSGDGYQIKLLNNIDSLSFCSGVVIPDDEQLNVINLIQYEDSLTSSNFYLGVLDSSDYSINITYDFGPIPTLSMYVKIELLNPELINSYFIGKVHLSYLNVNVGESRSNSNHSSTYVFSFDFTEQMPPIIDFHFITSKGIFTIPYSFFDSPGSMASLGCTNELYFEYDPMADTDDGTCENLCTCPYDIFLEHNPNSSYNCESSCINIKVYGCLDSVALNFNELATSDDESCIYPVLGCMDPLALNFNDDAVINESCIYEYIIGCTSWNSLNYNIEANIDDGSCIDKVEGCMDEIASNYNPESNYDDGSCVIFGCTLPVFPNYNEAATHGDGSCDMASEVNECDDPLAINYGLNDSLCVFGPLEVGQYAFGGIIFHVFDSGLHGFVAAVNDLEGDYQFGGFGEDLPTYGSNIGDGMQNTITHSINDYMLISKYGNHTITSNFNGSTFNSTNELQPSITEFMDGFQYMYTPGYNTPQYSLPYVGVSGPEAAHQFDSSGYSDWYLPSFEELRLMLNAIGPNSLVNIGEFSDVKYMSSSTFGGNSMHYSLYPMYPTTSSSISYRYKFMKVRPIRKF